MKATIDGITYEGSEEEIRRIVENPPHRPAFDALEAYENETEGGAR